MALEVKDLNSIEVLYSLADVYFPDTPRGHEEAERLFPDPRDVRGVYFAFCADWKGKPDDQVCANRDPYYRAGNNKCRRCPAGFMHQQILGMATD